MEIYIMTFRGVSASATLVAATLALTTFAIQPAQAASYCGTSFDNTQGLSKGDMSFNDVSASDCYGVVTGNDPGSAINDLAHWKTPEVEWTLLVKSDIDLNGGIGYGNLSGIAFTLSASAGTEGFWTLNALDTNGLAYANLPATVDFVGVLKAGTGFAAYFFDDMVVSADNNGTWAIAFNNNGGQVPDLSHLSLYTRIDMSGGIPAAIPEAQTYAMMLVGLGLVGFMARRRTRQSA